MAGFDPAKHPRAPKGQADGGHFTSGGGGAGPTNPDERRRWLADRSANRIDPASAARAYKGVSQGMLSLDSKPTATLAQQFRNATPEVRARMERNIAMNTTRGGYADAIYKGRMAAAGLTKPASTARADAHWKLEQRNAKAQQRKDRKG